MKFPKRKNQKFKRKGKTYVVEAFQYVKRPPNTYAATDRLATAMSDGCDNNRIRVSEVGGKRFPLKECEGL